MILWQHYSGQDAKNLHQCFLCGINKMIYIILIILFKTKTCQLHIDTHRNLIKILVFILLTVFQLDTWLIIPNFAWKSCHTVFLINPILYKYRQDWVDHSQCQKLVQSPFVSGQVTEYLSIHLRDFLSLIYYEGGYWALFSFNKQILVQTALTSRLSLSKHIRHKNKDAHSCLLLDNPEWTESLPSHSKGIHQMSWSSLQQLRSLNFIYLLPLQKENISLRSFIKPDQQHSQLTRLKDPAGFETNHKQNSTTNTICNTATLRQYFIREAPLHLLMILIKRITLPAGD